MDKEIIAGREAQHQTSQGGTIVVHSCPLSLCSSILNFETFFLKLQCGMSFKAL